MIESGAVSGESGSTGYQRRVKSHSVKVSAAVELLDASQLSCGGLATVKAFAEAGAVVVLADINEDALRSATDELTSAGHQSIGVSCGHDNGTVRTPRRV